jgi:signal transduction histidine kinase/chemotaxis response regulator CheB
MNDTEDRQTAQAIDIVVLVASAGGLSALSTVLQGLPDDLPAAVVVQQHLGGQGSVLVPMLRRRTGARIDWAVSGQRIQRGQVLVCPPLKRLELFPDDTCMLHESNSALGFPHDALLTAVADSYGTRALAVVLTGSGHDGAAGVAALKAAGGIAIAQSENTAEQPAMPRAAAEAGADVVLPLHDIAGVIGDTISGGPLLLPPNEVQAAAALFAGDDEVRRRLRDIDWTQSVLGPVHSWPTSLRTMLRVVLASPMPMIIIWGPDRIQLYNDHYRALMGPRHPAGLGQPNRDCWPEVWHLNAPEFDRVFGGESVALEDALFPIMRGGQLQDAWFTIMWTPVEDDDGVIAGAVGLIFETTERILAARRLTTINALAAAPVAHGKCEALQHAMTVLAEAPDVPFALSYLLDVTNRRAGLVSASGVEEGGAMAPREVKIPGGEWELREVIDKRCTRWMYNLAARFRGHTVGPDSLPPESALIAPLSDEADERVAGVLILGAHPRVPRDGRYCAFLGLAADTVSAKMAEADARRREHERLERLAELDSAKAEFFSNVSHEFRTPLTLMLGTLDNMLADDHLEPVERKRDLELIRRNAQRLLRLVGTLLDFSQLEAGRLRAHFTPTDLQTRTREIVAQFESAARRAGIALHVSTEPLPGPVWVDVEMWENIVSNLLLNALKSTFAGEIEVALRALPNHAELVVRDTGIGIPQQELPFLFRRFHRVHGARGRTHEGTGIGLAFVDELVRRHHGRIRVTSEVGVGTAFTVWVPLGSRLHDESTDTQPAPTGEIAAAFAEEVAHWDAGREERVAREVTDALMPHEPPPQRAAHARIVVVDDNADTRDYLTGLLSQQWNVVQARDGAEALERARCDLPDLIVADVMMPGVDGLQLLRSARSDSRLESVPVVLVTAQAGEDAAVEALLAGADDYIVKPFSSRELLARVSAQIELARLRRSSERRFRALMDASFDAVYRMSPDWSEMHALNGRGFIADTTAPSSGWLENYIDPADQPGVLAAIETAIATQSVFELEHRVRRADGTLGWTLSRAVPVLDDDGTIVEWVGTATDITSLKASSHAAPA